MTRTPKSSETYWRSLEELAAEPGFEEMLRREFPQHAAEWSDPVGRRRFLKLMGASMALAGATGCTRQPPEHIAPYVSQPESIVPGKPLYYATAATLGGYATGVLVETHEGRPTKIEGNPEHPASLGATDIYAQASVLGLYDPDRSQTLTHLGEIRPFSGFVAQMKRALEAQRALGGEGLRILTGSVTSDTLGNQLRSILRDFPGARWHHYEPLHDDRSLEGARAAFGAPYEPVYSLDRARVLVCLGADPLGTGPAKLKNTRDYMRARKLDPDHPEIARLYAVESTASLTGVKADHRLLVKPSRVEEIAFALAAELGVIPGRGSVPHAETVRAMARDIRAHRGSGVVIAGESQPPAVHALVHAINARYGNAGKTVSYVEPVRQKPVGHLESLHQLTDDMRAGRVDLLLILGGNPVYQAPADLGFAEALERVDLRAHLSLYDDETSERCHWHVPEAHYLEAWGDARAFDGTASIVQPTIRPLYEGRTAHELLAVFGDRPERSGRELVRETWKQLSDRAWKEALHRGYVAGTASRLRVPAVDESRVSRLAGHAGPAPTADVEIVFEADPTVHDGRFANNGWLQELPKPLTKLTWDNAALVNPKTAQRFGLATSFDTQGGEHGRAFADVAELRHEGRTVRAPVWIVPDQPDDVVTVHLGYGRTRSGQVGTGHGFDAYSIRTSTHPWSGAVEIERTRDRFVIANTQGHWNMEGRDLVRSGSLARFRKHPDLAPPHFHGEPAEDMTMYPPHPYEGYAWGMHVDLDACLGCNACIVACQAENNIPVVGKEQVEAGREMHWLRIDRYHKGDPADPSGLETVFQPVACQHCENAPCEIVCPVAATVHSAEGLNDMVYNRCVGTRYCANNCPYKVRRFNFFLYQDWETPSLRLARNPDVTVRSRGVMEKCTFCVQRINRAKIQAELENRPVRDGEITTACESACATGAIRFGDVNDEGSRVAARKRSPRNYSLLSHLNTRPRTTYSGAVRNWDSALRPEAHVDDGHGGSHDPQDSHES